MTRVAICLPDYGFDPTEAAIPFEYLTNKGWDIEIITQDGKEPQCDQRMISGMLSTVMGAKPPAKAAYQLLSSSTSFKNPKAWTTVGFSLLDYDVLILPGGHDKGVKQIIENESLRLHLAEFFPLTKDVPDDLNRKKKVCGAICHGVMVLAWAKDPAGKSLLYDRKTTTLPEHLEKMAYVMTAPVLGDYYRTYPGKYTAGLVQETPEQYVAGPFNLTASYAPECAHVVCDERYISARWPGDAHKWSETIFNEAVKAGLA
ncbi:hypothetical protein M408DRAFT_332258 [Serendipita vermifera MAFF 305830]|uniref:DJ-1/PfpI domain-containing protein n=1 Tax=Serendipita vermifera MAFF 305830 TaxID=933852 RepID=A0A0C2WB79_SERVB|nr:hypothetical protein M408DRAFT_332258 [Serendipita vermifera MAFF 305830]